MTTVEENAPYSCCYDAEDSIAQSSSNVLEDTTSINKDDCDQSDIRKSYGRAFGGSGDCKLIAGTPEGPGQMGQYVHLANSSWTICGHMAKKLKMDQSHHGNAEKPRGLVQLQATATWTYCSDSFLSWFGCVIHLANLCPTSLSTFAESEFLARHCQ